MLWGKNRGKWKKSRQSPGVEPGTPLTWTASALPLSHNSWTTTSIYFRLITFISSVRQDALRNWIECSTKSCDIHSCYRMKLTHTPVWIWWELAATRPWYEQSWGRWSCWEPQFHLTSASRSDEAKMEYYTMYHSYTCYYSIMYVGTQLLCGVCLWSIFLRWQYTVSFVQYIVSDAVGCLMVIAYSGSSSQIPGFDLQRLPAFCCPPILIPSNTKLWVLVIRNTENR